MLFRWGLHCSVRREETSVTSPANVTGKSVVNTSYNFTTCMLKLQFYQPNMTHCSHAQAHIDYITV